MTTTLLRDEEAAAPSGRSEPVLTVSDLTVVY
jgi:hypothetical protein